MIENAANPATEAWNNITAINRVVKDIVGTSNMIAMSAIQANAGAGGVYMSLAADYVFADKQIVFNPHYAKMGLYGSELHTFLGANRMGKQMLNDLKQTCEPIVENEAIKINLIDDIDEHYKREVGHISKTIGFLDKVKIIGLSFVNDKTKLERHLGRKRELFKARTLYKSFESYEREELSEMYQDIVMNRNEFNEKRRAFVRKIDSQPNEIPISANMKN